MPKIDPTEIFQPHDHDACATEALGRAESLCAAEGARLTAVRRRTLEILLETHRAMGAYDVLERLAEEGFGHQPPVLGHRARAGRCLTCRAVKAACGLPVCR